MILRLGHEGQEVARLRRALGFQEGDSYCRQTEASVWAHQVREKLSVDGVAGPETLRSLGIPIFPGIDVSHYQSDGRKGAIDWKAVRAAECRWAYIKWTEGATVRDAWAEHNRSEAITAGVVPGPYHLAHPENNTAAAEWKHFEQAAAARIGWSGRFCELPPALDIEQWDWRHVSTVEERWTWLAEWGNRAADWAGSKPVLYVGKAFLEHMLRGGGPLPEIFYLWVSRYFLSERIDPGYTGEWEEWTAWQWTGEGSHPGVVGNVDRDWMAGGQLGRLLEMY